MIAPYRLKTLMPSLRRRRLIADVEHQRGPTTDLARMLA